MARYILTSVVWSAAAALVLVAIGCGGDAAGGGDNAIVNVTVEPDRFFSMEACSPDVEAEITAEAVGFERPVEEMLAFFEDDSASADEFELERDAGGEVWRGTIPVGELAICNRPDVYFIDLQANDGVVTVGSSRAASIEIVERECEQDEDCPAPGEICSAGVCESG